MRLSTQIAGGGLGGLPSALTGWEQPAGGRSFPISLPKQHGLLAVCCRALLLLCWGCVVLKGRRDVAALTAVHSPLQEVDSRWLEYQTRLESLISWIKQHTILMSDKSFPQNPVELKVGPGEVPVHGAAWCRSPGWFLMQPFSSQALYNQYIHFKETEIPAREQEKGRIEELYKLLEVRFTVAMQRLAGGSAVLLARLVCSLQAYFGTEKWK